jgi:hypothetical protein
MDRHSNIDPLIPCYDAFFVDQFGTLHDGLMAYPGAAAALMRIRAAGRKVVLLSNSGRPLKPNANRLASLGIGQVPASKPPRSAWCRDPSGSCGRGPYLCRYLKSAPCQAAPDKRRRA